MRSAAAVAVHRTQKQRVARRLPVVARLPLVGSDGRLLRRARRRRAYHTGGARRGGHIGEKAKEKERAERYTCLRVRFVRAHAAESSWLALCG